MNDVPRRRLEDVKALADDAKPLIENKAFAEAVRQLRREWFDELMTSEWSNERKLARLAEIRALEAVMGRLKKFADDYDWAVKREARAHA